MLTLNILITTGTILLKLVFVILSVSGLILLLNQQFPYVLNNPDNYVAIISLVVILSFLILRIFNEKVNFNVVAKSLIAWITIFGVILIGYSYRYQLNDVYRNVMGNLDPSEAQTNNTGSVTFRKSINGHFLIHATVNGQVIHFLLDTGASKVTLSRSDAVKLGFDLKSLVYNIRMNTANGVNLAAYVRIDELKVGDIVMKDVGAYVNKSGLDSSLLGMNFLNRLSKYEVKREEVTFYD